MIRVRTVSAIIVLALFLSLSFLAANPVSATPTTGKIVVNHDEWTTTDFGFSQAPDTGQFVSNVASWFTGGTTGNFLAFSNNFSLTGAQIASTMTGAGHSWTVSTGVDFSLPNLLQYEGIFLAGNPADNSVLTDYVNAGGNVYLMGGTGLGGAFAEAARWNTFLNAFGLNFGAPYNGVSGVLPITSSHPIFAGVSALFQNNGNSVSEVNPTDPNTDILEFSGGHGLYGVFAEALIEVTVDIKPGSDPNCINNDDHGVIPIAILGSASFDVTQIDPATVSLDSLAVKAVGKSNKLLAHIEDVNSDGFDDLVLQIQDGDGAFLGGSGTATVTGNLFDGTAIEGTDSLCIVP